MAFTLVCEASCPGNPGECFNHGTATFMILGAILPAVAVLRCYSGRPGGAGQTNLKNWRRPLLIWRWRYVAATLR